MELIDKSAVIAEIERRIKEIDEIGTYLSPKGVLTNLLCHINTFETKEVDLEKEFYDFLNLLIGKDNGHLSEDELFSIAEYFFNLGLKLQKGE